VAENPRIEELRRRVQADPASIAFAALAEEFRRVGRYEDAIETCRVGLQRHPAYLSARVTLGRALIEVGDYEAARAELTTVLQSAPENIAATRGLAQIHERLGHSTELHPDLAAMMERPVTPKPAPPPPPAPVAVASFDLPLQTPPAADDDEPPAPDVPIDIFTAALNQPPAPPPIAFEAPASIVFEAPVVPAAQPDPHVAATLIRLEHFLGAIQTARHA
jgi:tetratricopeptide (TPR) repeat protein